MKLIHPQRMYQNLPPEDVFLAVDDVGTTHGTGYLMYQCQPSLDPDCPVNLYFNISGAESVRFLLFGALMARARQIRDYDPLVSVRVYTAVRPEDQEMLSFCAQNDLKLEDTEQRLMIDIPMTDGMIPMSCSVALTPLNTQEEVNAFLQRAHSNDLTHITPELFSAAGTMPHFRVLGLYRGTTLIGETLLAGAGDTVELYGIYIIHPERRQGFARALLHRSMAYMRTEGCLHVTASLLTRSNPSARLLRSFGARQMGIAMVYPSVVMEAPNNNQ